MSSVGNSSSRTETMISAVIGAVVQVVLTIILTSWTQLNIPFAVIAVLPIAFAAVVAFRFLLKRQKRNEEKDRAAQHEAKCEADEVSTVLKEMGIIGCTSRLTESKYEPVQCMKQARRRLYFMGILGSKWVTEPHIRAEFRQFLSRIQYQGGFIRFLMINPEGEAFKRLRNYRGGAISAESLGHFRALVEEFPCLQVRLYDQLPCFRLVFIDDSMLAVSRYKIDKEGYFQSKYGWEAPHLVIDSTAPWSLYDAFELYYQQIWDVSLPLIANQITTEAAKE